MTMTTSFSKPLSEPSILVLGNPCVGCDPSEQRTEFRYRKGDETYTVPDMETGTSSPRSTRSPRLD